MVLPRPGGRKFQSCGKSERAHRLRLFSSRVTDFGSSSKRGRQKFQFAAIHKNAARRTLRLLGTAESVGGRPADVFPKITNLNPSGSADELLRDTVTPEIERSWQRLRLRGFIEIVARLPRHRVRSRHASVGVYISSVQGSRESLRDFASSSCR